MEQKVVLQSQLYTLEQTHKEQPDILKDLGNLIPGVILINDMLTLKNIYMSDAGCRTLNKSREELQMMGSEYFSNIVFCEMEMKWIVQHFGALVQRNDPNEVTGFFQKVRPDIKSDWSHYYLSGKLMQADSNQCIYMGVPAELSNYTLHNIGKKLSLETPKPALFQQFSSLTKREKQILELIAKGFTNNEISNKLHLSLYTIETHRKNIKRKLDAKNLKQLIVIAEAFGL